MIRKLWPRLSSRAVEPAEQAGTLRAVRRLPSKQERCGQLGMRMRPATYVGGLPFSREDLSSVIDGRG